MLWGSVANQLAGAATERERTCQIACRESTDAGNPLCASRPEQRLLEQAILPAFMRVPSEG